MKTSNTVVYIPDGRGVSIGRYGMGNMKIGLEVFTYSRLPGLPARPALGAGRHYDEPGTCPGSTVECRAICYAAQPVAEAGVVREMWEGNAEPVVPPIPDECGLLRIHVSGDFDTIGYIRNWVARLRERPDVTCWAYTRSWRVPHLLGELEVLRALPNMQLFASMDASTVEHPPVGWRRAWIWRDAPPMTPGFEHRLDWFNKVDVPGSRVVRVNTTRRHESQNGIVRADHTPAYVCPEETGRKPDCVSCGYCFEGQKHDVVFLEH